MDVNPAQRERAAARAVLAVIAAAVLIGELVGRLLFGK